MKDPALIASVVQDLELPSETLDESADPEVGVDLPWLTQPEARPAPVPDSSQPVWLTELELFSPPPRLTVPAPPPKRTAPTPVPMLTALRRQTVQPEADPFEVFLAHNKVTANRPAPGHELTIEEPSPLGAQDRWWIDPPMAAPPPKPKPTIDMRAPALTPAQWRAVRRSPPRPRPSPPLPVFVELAEDAPEPATEPDRVSRPRRSRVARFASVAAMAGLCTVLAVTLFGRQSMALGELVVPPPPEREAVAALKAAEVEAAPVAPAPAAARHDRSENEKPVKRARATKKWAAQTWPAPGPKVDEPAPAAEPAPVEPAPAADELKRPRF